MPTPSALGLLGKLPPEVRLCIWDYPVPFNLSRLSEENKWNGKPKRSGTRLAVMCTSRILRGEISHYLYGNFQLRVHITSYNAMDPWIWFEIRRRRAIWQAVSVDEAITRGFGEFRSHKVHLTTKLHAKKVSDKGQVVMLWE
ncbi:hypothetical protein N8T08_000354 [Aspergillus melleus]|uniref:Uncharacterized protein n=1 Tax=Aspergillus melleus TaxID=138277 RepID=A0ACC3BB63_9EURO|nr:hypothetical protein N8T08_000354 [Aspergillus melleus]